MPYAHTSAEWLSEWVTRCPSRSHIGISDQRVPFVDTIHELAMAISQRGTFRGGETIG